MPRPASHLFYLTRLRRPLVDRAEGIYFWTQDGRRFIDGSSGADGRQYRPRQPERARRDEAADGQDDLRLPPAFRERAGRGAGRGGSPETCRAISTGSSSSPAARKRWNPAIKLARQWAVATGQPKRWKVICRIPVLSRRHASARSASPATTALTDTFAPQIAADADHPGADRLSRPRQPLDGSSAACAMPTCWRRRSSPKGRKACSPSSWSRSAARRPRAGRARQLLSRASARSATNTASC